MPPQVLLIVLCAAALNATWNAIVKGAPDKLLTTVLVILASAVLSAVILPFVDSPDPASWPFLGASLVCQIAYFLLLTAAYRGADMSEAYPVMRGAAPLLVALASAAVIGESLSAVAWAGVLLIVGGVLGLARTAGGVERLLLPLCNAVVIAAYTIIDGLGARRSGAPFSYVLWLNILLSLPFVGWAVTTRWSTFRLYAARHLPLGLVGGIATTGSYGLALWAMTHAPVAVVAALRETGLLFGLAISGTVLKERIGPARLAAALVIAAGAAALRLA
ncbi:MAG TPA: EamA family transporter [Stellaceae bacterium]|nr:EamA family transporter [Stellaceae bacterium]